jgi:hypothetical protein
MNPFFGSPGFDGPLIILSTSFFAARQTSAPKEISEFWKKIKKIMIYFQKQ